MKKRWVRYPKEFREEAVKIALQNDVSKSTIADELGITRSTLYKWITQSMEAKLALPKTGKRQSLNYQSLEQENRSLKAQLKRTQQERDILKKAAAYFASQDL